MPLSISSAITSGIRTLTANIVLEMGYATDLHEDALIATAAVLFVFILIINTSFSLLKKEKKDKTLKKEKNSSNILSSEKRNNSQIDENVSGEKGVAHV